MNKQTDRQPDRQTDRQTGVAGAGSGETSHFHCIVDATKGCQCVRFSTSFGRWQQRCGHLLSVLKQLVKLAVDGQWVILRRKAGVV